MNQIVLEYVGGEFDGLFRTWFSCFLVDNGSPYKSVWGLYGSKAYVVEGSQ